MARAPKQFPWQTLPTAGSLSNKNTRPTTLSLAAVSPTEQQKQELAGVEPWRARELQLQEAAMGGQQMLKMERKVWSWYRWAQVTPSNFLPLLHFPFLTLYGEFTDIPRFTDITFLFNYMVLFLKMMPIASFTSIFSGRQPVGKTPSREPKHASERNFKKDSQGIPNLRLSREIPEEQQK